MTIAPSRMDHTARDTADRIFFHLGGLQGELRKADAAFGGAKLEPEPGLADTTQKRAWFS